MSIYTKRTLAGSFILFFCCSILFWTLVLLVPFETIFMLKRQMNHTYTLYQKHFQLVCSAVSSSHSAKKTTTTTYKRIIKFLWECLPRSKPFLSGLTCQNLDNLLETYLEILTTFLTNPWRLWRTTALCRQEIIFLNLKTRNKIARFCAMKNTVYINSSYFYGVLFFV